ncbi:alpha-amylase [Flavobacterium alvei]|uniref:Alpha-amylase n=1 Tax=Flavobacterium alvei TaxID=2080416 RepID=A0A2S5ACT1_9FLAO|nr:alpha-amylase family glycosyl hydrolase [Flavobacterium alvei]POY40368.1 alpha-amylase [Flavobacterium alvei]
MKKIIFLFFLIASVGFSQTTTTPSPALAEGAVTINFNKGGTPLASTTDIYAHIGVTVNGTRWQNTKGNWGTTNAPLLTLVSGTTYKLDLGPDLYTYFGVPVTSSITEICVVFRNATGSVQTSPDIFINVGVFQATLTAPGLNSTNIISSGSSLNITANNTSGTANYNLFANGTSINTFTGSSYSFTDTNIVANKNYDLQITQGATVFSKKFSVIVRPVVVSETIPAGLVDGINYNSGDLTKATLVLDAPGKDFVYVAGSFNNWQPGTGYAMKKDATAGSTKFWLELTGLVSGTNYTYQYWVIDETPIAGSPTLVKTADPYSTLVLNKEDDPTIPAGNYPNLPVYPAGQDREVTVLQTGQTPYAWSTATTNFVKPEKDKLVVYEVLVRDFDSNRSYQNLINKIDYFKNLKINAIELMPVMEFDGNESWGYNTSFHMALDKAYGPSSKLKEFIDLCHQNGIAVILDVALNHAFARNPMDRMWMNDPDGDGWGGPAADNPYFNVSAMHSYNVGNDFNHQLPRTKTYVKRVVKQWIEEYKIDGFRWDLTKGFTQNCPSAVAGGQDNCTNTLQQDRVDVLKEYADYSWSLDPTHYVIFEHLGNDNEEQLWANYRITETPSKGVMMWGKMTTAYSQLLMGWNSDNDISRIGSNAHIGFQGKRVMGYPESHDEERVMYKAVTYGNSTNPSHNVKTLTTALSRMSALGAISLLVPGPKMIWHFADLGMNNSIFTASNGVVNTDSDATPGDAKLDTKPQPQWTSNWLADADRSKIYADWSKMINLKLSLPVFNGSYSITSGYSALTPKVYIWDNNIPLSQLKNVVILSNFDVTDQSVNPSFPYTGTWYNLMDNTSINVTDVNATLLIAAGGFKIYGNQPSTLGVVSFGLSQDIFLYPNPSSTYFTINANTSKVEVYSVTGQLVKSFKPNQSKEYQFAISDLNKGVYFVKALNENNEVKVLKFVKQ